VGLAKPGDKIVLASSKGQAVQFDESGARSMGRTSRGVRGIRLRGDDQVVAMVVAEPESFLLTVCEFGYGKRTPIEDYPVRGRGGLGVINIRTTERNGPVVGMCSCRDDDEVMYITAGGMIVRSPVQDTRPMGRSTQGVRMVNLKDGDGLVGIEIVSAADLEAFDQGAGVSEDAAAPAEAAGSGEASGEPSAQDVEEQVEGDEDEPQDGDQA